MTSSFFSCFLVSFHTHCDWSLYKDHNSDEKRNDNKTDIVFFAKSGSLCTNEHLRFYTKKGRGRDII